jgi:REP element-mobilizing transposase RayT
LIRTELKHEVFAYLAALIREKKGMAIVINGMADHVHFLVMLPPDVSLSDAMRFIKANSSRWMKRRSGKAFAWQKGFGAFSVSRSNADAVAKYIRDQEKHHQKIDLRDEYLSLLQKNEAQYDPLHLWD